MSLNQRGALTEYLEQGVSSNKVGTAAAPTNNKK